MSVFSKIIAGEIPCYKIAEDENCFAFLDINPLNEGHTLVIPKVEVDYIFDLDDEQFMKLHLFSKKVAVAIKESIPCLRVGMAVIGLEVPHAHIHLVPLHSAHDIDFKKQKMQFSKEEFASIAEKIKKHLK